VQGQRPSRLHARQAAATAETANADAKAHRGQAMCMAGDLSASEASVLFDSTRLVAFYPLKDEYVDRMYEAARRPSLANEIAR